MNLINYPLLVEKNANGVTLYASKHKDQPFAVAEVLKEVAAQVDGMPGYYVSHGYLDQALTAEDMRRQLTLEMYRSIEKSNIPLRNAIADKTHKTGISCVVEDVKLLRLQAESILGAESSNLSMLLRATADKIVELGVKDIQDLRISEYTADDYDVIEIAVYYRLYELR